MFKQTVIAMALMGATTVHASDRIKDDQLCEKAVEYSVKFMPEESASKLHNARWDILSGDRTDDTQKMVGIVVFEMGQRLSYIYDSEEHGAPDEWFPAKIEGLGEDCEILLEEMRSNQSGIESANPDEAW